MSGVGEVREEIVRVGRGMRALVQVGISLVIFVAVVVGLYTLPIPMMALFLLIYAVFAYVAYKRNH